MNDATMTTTNGVDGIIPVAKLSLEDFELGDVLGEGSYAQVIEARHRKANHVYALKVVDKRHVLRQNKQQYVMSEKAILSRLDHPGIIRLFGTFQDEISLYFILELADGGELLQQIKSIENCPEDHIQFWCAEILLILEYLHNCGIVHRDLKPENLLLKNGHIKLVDFGSAKDLSSNTCSTSGSKRRNSFVGTAEYVSPELLNNEPVEFEADLWAFGCIIYQILCGRPPFKGESEYLTFQKIINFEIEFPPHLSVTAKTLIQRLLSKNPKERLGDGFISLKKHPFFDGISFDDLFTRPAPGYSSEKSESIKKVVRL